MRARILRLDGWFNEKSDYLDTVLFTQLKPSTIIVTRCFLNLVRSWIQARLISQKDTKSNYYLHTIAERIYEVTTRSLLFKECVMALCSAKFFGIYRTCTYTAVMTSEQYTQCHSLGAELSIESAVVVNGGFLSSRFPSEVRRCIVLTEKPYKTVQCCKTPFQHFWFITGKIGSGEKGGWRWFGKTESVVVQPAGTEWWRKLAVQWRLSIPCWRWDRQ